MRLTIRQEQAADFAAVEAIHSAAFPSPAEARLVDRLRATNKAAISLVAEVDGTVVGHVLFSPISVAGLEGHVRPLGLAPVAVLPEMQKRGIGSRLIIEGLSAAARSGHGFVVCLGEPAYYKRFGFRPASARGLANEYGAGDAFMVVELKKGAIPADGGLVKYAPEFTELAA